MGREYAGGWRTLVSFINTNDDDDTRRPRRRRPMTTPTTRAARAVLGMAVLLTLGGCDATPPPPRVPIPATSNRESIRDRDHQADAPGGQPDRHAGRAPGG